MTHVARSTLYRLTLSVVIGTLGAGWVWPLTSEAQNTTADAATHQHGGQSTDVGNDLSAQLRDLQARAAALQAALEERYPGAADRDAAPHSGMGMMGSSGMRTMGDQGMGTMGGDSEMAEMMKMMRTMMEMRMMQMKANGMGMMNDEMMSAGMEGMGMMGDGMDMMGMMGMGGTGMRMTMASALPGFPGASHIYHIGATGFFLDHPEHIQLAGEQQAALNGIKEKALQEQATMKRQIDEAEQELWTLTASDEPDATRIDAKVREIEKLRGDQRLAFIRAVGEAANVLTAEQRQVLVGSLSQDTGASTEPNH